MLINSKLFKNNNVDVVLLTTPPGQENNNNNTIIENEFTIETPTLSPLESQEPNKKKESITHSIIITPRSNININPDNSNSNNSICCFGKGYVYNSFFAMRLIMITLFIAILDIVSLILYYMNFFNIFNNGKISYKSDGSPNGCRTVTKFSVLVFHIVILNLLFILPAFGFQPFDIYSRQRIYHKTYNKNNTITNTPNIVRSTTKLLNSTKYNDKTDDSDESDNENIENDDADNYDISVMRIKVQRTLFLKILEILSVGIFLYQIILFFIILRTFFLGGVFSCNDLGTLAFTFMAFITYWTIFIQITIFSRFREHIKMQLGAFKESDQTSSNILKNNTNANLNNKNINKNRLILNIRKKLYKAVEYNDIKEVKSILIFAKRHLGDNFVDIMYNNRYKKYWKTNPSPSSSSSNTVSNSTNSTYIVQLMFLLYTKSLRNPLHLAAYRGNIDIMDILVKAGFKVNVYDKFSRVRFSTGNLFWYFLRIFITRHQNISHSDDNDVSIFHTTLITPLHCATLTSRVEAVKWLIDNKADVNAISRSTYRRDQISPLFLAEHPAIVEYLLDNGANILSVPDPGYLNTVTALELAYLKNNYAVAQVLEEWGGDIALTPLHAAAANNDYIAVNTLLKRHANPNCRGEQGYTGLNARTPLHWAAVMGCTDSMRSLLKYNANPNLLDNEGRTPLHWASRLKRTNAVKMLLDYGADVSILDNSNMTPILCAAWSEGCEMELFKALILHGALINQQLPSTGDTPLHIAVSLGNRETALNILKCGGDIMLPNYNGYRPIDCTTSTELQFSIKKAAGKRDVMISYTHSHMEFAKKIRKHLEESNITTWLDLMDPSGIGGGAVWRDEIARGILNAALVLCIITEDYIKSEWCLKELALAKQFGTPVLGISTENVVINEELQVYLYTRQLIPFEKAIISIDNINLKNIVYTYDDASFKAQFRLLLDGVRDEIEKKRQIGLKENKEQYVDRDSHNSISIIDTPETIIEKKRFLYLCNGNCNIDFTKQIYDELRTLDIPVYLDSAVLRKNNIIGNDNNPNEDFADKIHKCKEAILRCKCFIVILSEESCKSEIVNDQLSFAEDKGKPILPILLTSPQIPLGQRYTLSRCNLYHFSNNFGFQQSFKGLLRGVKKHVKIKKPNTNSVAIISSGRKSDTVQRLRRTIRNRQTRIGRDTNISSRLSESYYSGSYYNTESMM